MTRDSSHPPTILAAMAEREEAPKKSAPQRPTIALPPRDHFFRGGAAASPGPMTLVSNFFADTDSESECRSFSQLLAGAMASPGARWVKAPDHQQESRRDPGDGGREDGPPTKQASPASLVMAQSPGFFTIPPGLSPGGFLDSPGLFSAAQGQFGMISHQQALAQVTAQAAQSQAHMHIQTEYPQTITPQMSVLTSCHPSHPVARTTLPQQTLSMTSGIQTAPIAAVEVSHSDKKPLPSTVTADKPSDDGFNWRKYGQKQVKGSEYPRSYYKCSHLNCPVKKKVERSVDGQVTEIIYKGQHNHQKPQQNRRSKESGPLSSGSADLNGRIDLSKNSQNGSQNEKVNSGQSEETIAASSLNRKDRESSQVTPEQLSGSSDGEEVADAELRTDAGEDNDPDVKRRRIDVMGTEASSSHRTVMEPKIIVQTTSEVDLLDDGYRWRKYGQKVVKGNPYPRSYYKCTSAGCNVRKHVERSSSDLKAVITTYEGKHNHDVPVAKNSSHSAASSAAAANNVQLKPQGNTDKYSSVKRIDFRNNEVHQPVSFLHLKEEREAV